MDAQITEFIDILKDNSMVIKFYKPEEISSDDPRFDNFEFNDDLLISTHELYEDELWNYLEFEIVDFKTPRKFELNHYSKIGLFEDFLNGEFQKFKFAIANSFNGIDKSELKEVIIQIKNSRNELELLLRINSANKNINIGSLVTTKLDFCNEATRFLDYSTFIFSNRTETKQNTEEVKPPKPKKQLDNLTSLTQNQAVILFHYLRQLGYVGKEMPNNLYAQHISELTGFSGEKIRQNLSHIGKESQSLESVLFTEADYSIARRAMEKLITTIKTDSEEKFS